MKPAHDEVADLLDTLIFTLRMIAMSDAEGKQRIANAYRDACCLVASIGLGGEGSARPRIAACIERFRDYRAADDIAAAGWMLKAIQERATEHDLEGRQSLQKIVNDVVRELPGRGEMLLH